jgi:hypothetical protein
MPTSSKRFPIVEGEKPEAFLKIVAKKYKGRYYKNLGKWTFPLEAKEKIEEEFMRYEADREDSESSSESSASESLPGQEDMESATSSSSDNSSEMGVPTTLSESESSATSTEDLVDTRDASVQTENECPPLTPTAKYRYDLPEVFATQFKTYKDLLSTR